MRARHWLFLAVPLGLLALAWRLEGTSRDERIDRSVVSAPASRATPMSAPTELAELDAAGSARSDAPISRVASASTVLDSGLELAPVAARVVYAGAELPVPFHRFVVEDENGVSVRVRTDANGRVRSTDLLALGAVELRQTPPPLLVAERSAEIYERGLLGPDIGRNAKHTGAPEDEDRWEVRIGPCVPVRVTHGSDCERTDRRPTFHAHLAPGTTTSPLDAHQARAMAESFGGSGCWILRLPSSSAKTEFTMARWSRIDEDVPTRVLHVVKKADGLPLVASVDASCLPLLADAPLEVELHPLAVFNAQALTQRFGPTLAKMLLDEIERVRARATLGFGGAEVSGAVETQSGRPVEGLEVFAVPVDALTAARAGAVRKRITVAWHVENDGRHRGSFCFSDLGAIEYELRLSRRGRRVSRPGVVSVTAPHIPENDAPPMFVVLDEVERVGLDLDIEVPGDRTSQGLTVNWNLEGALDDSPLRFGATALVPRNESEHRMTLCDDMPVGAEFALKFEVTGYEPLSLPAERFPRNGDRRIGRVAADELIPAD
ncbi:MAG: hypothetical protein AAGA20_16250 [Planctomycetota bacterium]